MHSTSFFDIRLRLVRRLVEIEQHYTGTVVTILQEVGVKVEIMKSITTRAIDNEYHVALSNCKSVASHCHEYVK